MVSGMFKHRLRVRYAEVDLQGVVFNAHYLAYCDDAMDAWFRSVGTTPSAPNAFSDLGWDCMLKKTVIEWHGSARVADVLEIECRVLRWGNTSFDVGFEGRVGDRAVLSVITTYVGVRSGTSEPMRVPDVVRERLGAV